mgnify:CR=1 FL=1
MIQKSYRKFLESQDPTISVDEGLRILNELEEIFIDLEDNWGFNITPKIRMGKNLYDRDGNVLDTITGKAYIRNQPPWIWIMGSKDSMEIEDIEKLSKIILLMVENSTNLLNMIEINNNTSILEIFDKSSGSRVESTFHIYTPEESSYSKITWATNHPVEGHLSLDHMLNLYKKFDNRQKSLKLKLVFKILDQSI